MLMASVKAYSTPAPAAQPSGGVVLSVPIASLSCMLPAAPPAVAKNKKCDHVKPARSLNVVSQLTDVWHRAPVGSATPMAAEPSGEHEARPCAPDQSKSPSKPSRTQSPKPA
jgi:hypothetical protein